ncbi:MAG TPA: hypothetical protein VIK55_14010, partial [Paludibacter sp.]
MSDYIPKSDADMNVWQGNMVEIVETNLIAWGILTEDFTVLKAKQSTWTTDYAKASNKQNRTAADVLAKDEAYNNYVGVIRPFVAQWLANNNKVTD